MRIACFTMRLIISSSFLKEECVTNRKAINSNLREVLPCPLALFFSTFIVTKCLDNQIRDVHPYLVKVRCTDVCHNWHRGKHKIVSFVFRLSILFARNASIFLFYLHNFLSSSKYRGSFDSVRRKFISPHFNLDQSRQWLIFP